MEEAHDDEEQMEVDQEEGALFPAVPLYLVDITPLRSRRSRHLAVEEQVAVVHLRDNPDAREETPYDLLEELALALTRAIQCLLERYPNLDERDRLYFSLGSSQLRTQYDGWGVTVGEWRSPNDEYKINRVFENLALMLNSNETFQVNNTFTMNLVVVRALRRGGGKHNKRIVPGEVSASILPQIKRSILQVPKDDRNMCCAEALWLAYKRDTLVGRAFDAQYEYSKLNKRPFQSECESLQLTVGIPFGTKCGPEELKQFADYFKQVDYSILVIDSSRGYMGFRYGDCENLLGLYYENGHYHTLRKVRGLFTKNLYYFDCLRPYDNLGSHQCTANTSHCPACLQNGCEDYLQYLKTHDQP